MIGRGMPISHSSAPFPKPIVASIHVWQVNAVAPPRFLASPMRRTGARAALRAASVAAGDMTFRTVLYFFAGASTMVFDEPSGAACIPGGVWPCGLSARAPPDFVSSGPVFPCGCAGPCFSGMIVRPVEYCESLLGSAAVVCWEMAPPVRKSPSAATAMRMISPG